MLPALDDLGARFLGTIIAGVLWGVVGCQAFHYFTTRPKDSRAIKTLVAVVCASDATQQLLIFVTLYDYCVTHFGSIPHLAVVSSTTPATLALTVFQAMVVQGFYISKIWELSHRNKLILAFMVLLVAAEASFGILLIYTSSPTPGKGWDGVLAKAKVIVETFCGLGFAVDTVITATISILLRRSKTEYAHTNSMIGRLIIFFASTNLLTALSQLAMLVMYLVFPKRVYVLPMSFVVNRMYSNSLLAALNMRPYIRQDHRAAFESIIPTNIGLSDMSSGEVRVRVMQHTSTHFDTDKRPTSFEGNTRTV